MAEALVFTGESAARVELLQDSLQARKAHRLTSPPRKPRSSFSSHGSGSLFNNSVPSLDTDEEQSPTIQEFKNDQQQWRRSSFGLRSLNSVASLLSMASAASASGHYGGSPYDSDSTVEDRDGQDDGSVESVPSNGSDPIFNYAEDDDDLKVAEWMEDLEADIVHEHYRTMQMSWEALKAVDGKDDKDDDAAFLGEQIMLRMMHLDPKSRCALGVSSFRSPRYSKLCHYLVDTVAQLVELMLSRVNKNSTQDAGSVSLKENFESEPWLSKVASELPLLAQGLSKEGFDLHLLEQAVVHGIQSSVPPTSVWTPKIQEAWESTIVKMLGAMNRWIVLNSNASPGSSHPTWRSAFRS